MRTTLVCALIFIGAVFPACKKKSPITTSIAPTTTVADVCTPGFCSSQCACGARQVCAGASCVYDPAFHVSAIALGAATFACALYDNGQVWCAGKNVVGQLGNGKPIAGPAAVDEAPAAVVGIKGATQIVAGVFHACALVSGSVWCWGLNGSGELGTKVDVPGVGQMTSTPVKVNHLDDAIAIAAGNAHSCAIKKDGSVACWGGHPGEGRTENAGARVIKGVTKAWSLALGFQESCALRLDSTVVCWSLDGAAADAPIKSVDEIARTQFSTCARVDTKVKCWGGRFGAHPVDVPDLENLRSLSGGTDLICGITRDLQSNVRCSDTKTSYRVTVGDSGVHVSARLLAVSGELTMNVHVSDNDIVDVDDDHPSKAVIDALGSGSTPQPTVDQLAALKGSMPAAPVAAEIPPSCDEQKYGGTCTEYSNGTSDLDAKTRCSNDLGTWSDSPCTRNHVLGTCVIGSKLDHGATMVIYESKFTKGQTDAHAMCAGGFDGTYTEATAP
ncbi:MAG: hypothetical protein ABI183_16905 [Polyangiaceae bacterium]